MAFNPDEGEAVDTGFNPDLGEPVDTTFNPDAGTQVDSTYAYASNDEYEDLKRAVGEVGYSGLDENQKKLFDTQLPASKAARAGMTAQQIHDYVDQAAGVNEANSNAGSAWTLGRSLLSLPVAAIGGLIGGFDKYTQDPRTGMAVERMPESTYWDRVNADQNEILENAKNNQGFAGFASNPANVLGGVASAPFRIGSPLVKGAIEGAGVSAVDQYANTGKVELLPMAGSAILGGGINKVGSALSGKVKAYEEYKSAKDLMENDPLAYAFDHPSSVDNGKALAAYREKVDPMGLADEYNYMSSEKVLPGSTQKLDPMDQKVLFAKAKQDIIDRSPFNRKGSTVTDREAREHIEGILNNIDNFKYKALEAPVNPLASTKSQIASTIENTPVLNFLDNGGVRGLSSSLATGVNTAVKVGASPVGSFLRKLPITPTAIGTTSIDRF